MWRAQYANPTLLRRCFVAIWCFVALRCFDYTVYTKIHCILPTKSRFLGILGMFFAICQNESQEPLAMSAEWEVAPEITSGLYRFLGACWFIVVLWALALWPTILKISPQEQIRVATQTGSNLTGSDFTKNFSKMFPSKVLLWLWFVSPTVWP